MRAALTALSLGILLPGLALAAPQAAPPDAPLGLSYTFTFSRGAGNKPTVSLAWEPSVPSTYLLAGYRVLRRVDQEGSPLAPQAVLAPASAAVSVTASAAAVGLTGSAKSYTGHGAAPSPTSTPIDTPTNTPSRTPTPLPAAAALTGTALAVQTLTGGAPLSVESFDDASVFIGGIYTYWVQAVDVKGNTGALSKPLSVDLSRLPEFMLAPARPEKLTAKPGREQVNLEWAPAAQGVDQVSRYILFRSPGLDDLDQGMVKTEVFDVRWADAPPSPKKTYIYRVKAVDTKGRASDFSDTVSAMATGTLPPQPPMKLTARIGGETVSLSWEAAPAGTAPVSEYLIRRKSPASLGGQWVDIYAPRSASLTAYTDRGLDPEVEFIYEVRAVDAESNTSEPATLSAVPQKIPFNKTGILLVPTAFSNRQDGDTGPNLNVMFSYYIGSLFETYADPEEDNRSKSYILQRINIGTATMDFKYSLLPDTWLTPCLAVGIYTTTLINFSQPSSGSSQTVGVSSGGTGGGDSFSTLGGAYVVASKWLGDRTAVHLGLMRGNLANDLSAALPPNWNLTVRHLLPGGNFPELLTRLVDPGLNVQVDSSPHMLMGGFQVPFTIPLYFFKWRTGIKAEYLTPIFPEVSTDKLPFMINAHMDNMPLFGFEFSYFKYFQGYEIIGFYHFRDLNW